MDEGNSTRRVCSDCNKMLNLNGVEPCPECGSAESKILADVSECVKIADGHYGLETRQWYESNPKLAWFILLVSIAIPIMVSLILDQTVGLVIAIVASLMISFGLPSLRTMVIEKKKL